jgi:hypothetical protein
MNDRDMMILMTIHISRSLLNFSFSLWFVSVALFIHLFRGRFLLFFFSSGICSCILSIHTVDHWVVFDTIYTHSGTPF